MANNSELFATLIEGLSALNQRLNDLEVDTDGTKKEINDFQSEYAKEVKLLQQQIDEITIQIDRLIKEAIKEIPIPKDGKDGADYDEDVAKALLKAEINKLIKQRNLEVEKIKSEVLQAVENIPVQKGDKGEDGKSVTDEQIQTYISIWLDDNIDSLKGEDGKRGIQGLRGKSGEDGVSIIDAKIENDYLVLTFSDGNIKRVKLPRQNINMGGGGIVSQETVNHIKLDELLSMFNSAYSTSYSELTYSDGNITNIDVYENDTKVKKLFTKEITYSDGNIIEIKITNTLTGYALTKTIGYDANGNLIEIRIT